MTPRPDPLAVLGACITKLSVYEQGPEEWLSPRGQAALADVERLVEAARPMANLPWPLSADERQQWIVHQNRLRDALAMFEEES